jgi:hypothetical protein
MFRWDEKQPGASNYMYNYWGQKVGTIHCETNSIAIFLAPCMPCLTGFAALRQLLVLCADKWCQGIMKFNNFCGQTTTGACEAFNRIAKDMFNRLGGHKHCWRIDKLVHHLMHTILPHYIHKQTLACTGTCQLHVRMTNSVLFAMNK